MLAHPICVHGINRTENEDDIAPKYPLPAPLKMHIPCTPPSGPVIPDTTRVQGSTSSAAAWLPKDRSLIVDAHLVNLHIIPTFASKSVGFSYPSESRGSTPVTLLHLLSRSPCQQDTFPMERRTLDVGAAGV